jgi:hypothetical protein
MGAPMRVTIKVLRQAQGRQKFGNQSRDYSHDISGCSIAPHAATRTNNQGGEIEKRIDIEEDIDVYLPMGADLLATDWIELDDGDVYKVIGKPQTWKPRYSNMRTGRVALARRIYSI